MHSNEAGVFPDKRSDRGIAADTNRTRASLASSVLVLTILLIGLTARAQVPGSNAFVIENQHPGSTGGQIPWGSAGNDSVGHFKGDASDVSVNKGRHITVSVSVNPSH